MILHFSARVKKVTFDPKDGQLATVIQLESNLEPSELQELAKFGERQLQVQFLFQEVAPQQPRMFDNPRDYPILVGGVRCANCGAYTEGLVCPNCGQQHRTADVVAPGEPDTASSTDGHCMEQATHAIHYGAGDDMSGTLFACDAHRDQVEEMARRFGEAVTVEEIPEDKRGKIICHFQGTPDGKPTHQPCGAADGDNHVVCDAGEESEELNLCPAHLGAYDPGKEMEVDDAPEGSTCEYPVPIPQDDPDPVCICGHRLSCHGAPGELCRAGTAEGVIDGPSCDCTIFRSAVEAAADDPHADADAAAEADQHARHMAEAAAEPYEEPTHV